MSPKICITISLICLYTLVFSQKTSNNSNDWIDFFSYNHNTQLANSSDKIYCANKNAIFYLQKSDMSIHQLSKINELSDAGVSSIACDPTGAYLIVGYNDGNIDIINNGQTTNIIDLKTKLINAQKSINTIVFLDGMAFLSTSFGIIVLDYKKALLVDTYILSGNGDFVAVNQIYADSATHTVYAATNNGICYAQYGSANLSDFNNWTKIGAFGNSAYNGICYANNILYVNRVINSKDSLFQYKNATKSLFKKQYDDVRNIRYNSNKLIFITSNKIEIYDSIFMLKKVIDSVNIILPNFYDACIDRDGSIWALELTGGLYHSTDYKSICPQGPRSDEIASISRMDNTIALTHGEPFKFRTPVLSYLFLDYNLWVNFTDWGTYDQMRFAYYPKENNHFVVGTWGDGIASYDVSIWNKKQSYKTSNCSIGGDFISGLVVDTNKNLFVYSSNSDFPFSVMTKSGDWYKWKYNNFTRSIDPKIMILDKNNWKWSCLDDGVFVFNDKNTPLNADDDDSKFISLYDNTGIKFSEGAMTIAFDLNNTLWVGTSSGLAYYSTPDQIFSDSKPTLSRNKITVNGVVDYLLASETILCIEVDAANRKWIGTIDGLFLVNSNGTEVLQHFTVDNSPLPANSISSLKIISERSLLLIGTLSGMIGYNIGIKEARPDFSQIAIYPNPVKHDFTGLIRIEGLMDNTTVKIMDIDGNLVYEAVSEGGTAFWNGNNLIGKRVASGVYVVIFVNSDQTQKKVSKIFFIH